MKYLLTLLIAAVCFSSLIPGFSGFHVVQVAALKTTSKLQGAPSSAGSDLQRVAGNLHVAAASAAVGVGLSCFLL